MICCADEWRSARRSRLVVRELVREHVEIGGELGQFVGAALAALRLVGLRPGAVAGVLRQLGERLDDVALHRVGREQRDDEPQQQRDRHLLEPAPGVAPDPCVVDDDADGAGQARAQLDRALEVNRLEREVAQHRVQEAVRRSFPVERRRGPNGVREIAAHVALQHVAVRQTQRGGQVFRVRVEIVQRAAVRRFEPRRHRVGRALGLLDHVVAGGARVPDGAHELDRHQRHRDRRDRRDAELRSQRQRLEDFVQGPARRAFRRSRGVLVVCRGRGVHGSRRIGDGAERTRGGDIR